MSIEQLLAVATFALVAAGTPGPNNVLLTATGARVGVRRGLPVLAGIAGGFAFMVFALALGVGEAIRQTPEMRVAMRGVGVAVVLWLAWRIARAPVQRDDGTEDADTVGRCTFLEAALFQWVNPKAWLITGAAITAYVDPALTAVQQASLFATVFLLAALVACLPWLAFGSAIKRLLVTERRARRFNYAMAALLAASVLWILATG